MPMVRRGDRNDINAFVVEHLADVFYELWLDPLPLLDFGGAAIADLAVHIDHVRDDGVLAPGIEPIVTAAAPVHPDDRHIQLLIGTLALAFLAQQQPAG